MISGRSQNGIIATPLFARPLSESASITSIRKAIIVHALHVEIEKRLRQSAYLELRRIGWTIHKKVLRLDGFVSSYYLRQVAQAMLKGLDGIETIENCLEVGRPAARPPVSRSALCYAGR
jgi:hypothetical protein